MPMAASPPPATGVLDYPHYLGRLKAVRASTGPLITHGLSRRRGAGRGGVPEARDGRGGGIEVSSMNFERLAQRPLQRDGIAAHRGTTPCGGDVPVVFQHGLCGSAQQTAEAFPDDSRILRLLTLECRGHGSVASRPGRRVCRSPPSPTT